MASSIGFIASLVVITASVSTAVYFMAEMGTFVERDDGGALERAASRALEVIAGTPGQPLDWDEAPAGMRRPGLLDEDTLDRGSYAKVALLRDGTITGRILADTLDLTASDLSIHVRGTLLPAPLLDPPATPGAVVAHFDLVDPLVPYEPAAGTAAAVALIEAVDPGIDGSFHDWSFDWTRGPEEGLGDVFADHPWEVQFNLIPRLAGIAATYTTANDGGSPSDAHENTAFLRYTGVLPGNRLINRWQVRESQDSPDTPPLPGGGAPGAGDHVLTFAFRHPQANPGAGGVGLWRSYEGDRTWAIVGPVDVARADELQLSFYHYLKIADAPDLLGTTNPTILFWDAKDPDDDGPNWEPLATEPACNDDENIGWHNTDEDETGTDWVTATVDLCDVIARSDGDLWLAFYWDTFCGLPAPGETPCLDLGGGIKSAWFLDDIEITRTVLGVTQTVYQTDFEAPYGDDGETLFVAQGVALDEYLKAPKPVLTYEYLEHFVERGGGILAMAPGKAGDWLATIGLDGAAGAGPTRVETLEPSLGIMHFPNRLPSSNESYASTPVAWEKDADGTDDLTPVQQVAGVNPATATLLTGRPRGATGGTVTALSYDLVDFPEPALRDDLFENAYSSLLFLDAAFSTDDLPRPETGSRPIAAAHQTMLVPVTTDGVYQATVDIVVYVWRVALEE